MEAHDSEETAPAARPAKPRRRWLLRGSLAFVVLIALTMIGHARWSGQARRRFSEMVARYRAAGEPMTPEDLTSRPVPDAQNAVIDLRAAAAAIDTKGRLWESFNYRHLGLPLREPEVNLLAQLVETNRDTLAGARRAAGKNGVDWGLKYQTPLLWTLLPDLSQQRNLARFLGAAALYAHHTGDDAEAVRRLREILRISRAVDEQPFLVTHLVAVGITAIAVEAAEQIAPDLRVALGAGRAPAPADDGPGTPVDAQELRLLLADLLDAAGPTEGLKRGLRGERVVHIDAADAIVRGKLDLAQFRGIVGSSGTGSSAPAEVNRYVLWPTVLNDASRMADYMAGAIEAAAAPDWPTARAKMPPPLKKELSRRPLLHPFGMTVAPGLDGATEQHYRMLTDRRLAATALAVRWYAVDHGGVPPRQLSDLVPNYLPGVPLDAMAAGRPLAYQPAGDHSDDPILYGVGGNGTDDGGSEKPSDHNAQGTPVGEPEDRVLHLKRQPRPPPDPADEREGIPLAPGDAAGNAATRPSATTHAAEGRPGSANP